MVASTGSLLSFNFLSFNLVSVSGSQNVAMTVKALIVGPLCLPGPTQVTSLGRDLRFCSKGQRPSGWKVVGDRVWCWVNVA